MYDGNVAVYNLKSDTMQPAYISSAACGKHQDLVWQVKWVQDNLDGYLNFYSIAGDGRITNWTLVKVKTYNIKIEFQIIFITIFSSRPPCGILTNWLLNIPRN